MEVDSQVLGALATGGAIFMECNNVFISGHHHLLPCVHLWISQSSVVAKSALNLLGRMNVLQHYHRATRSGQKIISLPAGD